MTLSPFEVERREFGNAPMGYRKRDVDHFVDEVQRSLRGLWEERSDAREENEVLKERLARFEQIEEQLKNTLLLAQDSAEKSHEQARRESELILREAGQKSRDIVHAAHEEKQKLELVLRDLHGAEQEARQRLRAMSGAILSHLDDTEQLVNDGSGKFRAIVQAHPEATELRSTSVDAVAGITERAAIAAEVRAEEVKVEAQQYAERIALDAELAAVAATRLESAEHVGTPARMRRTRTETSVDTLDTLASLTPLGSLGTTAAASETADAFFDTPPTFDPTDVAPRERSKATIDTP